MLFHKPTSDDVNLDKDMAAAVFQPNPIVDHDFPH